MSKVIERIVAEQLRAHLTECDLMPPVQSAYCQGYSTETALIKIIADIIDAADCQKVTLLSLLDMSAAFDTVDHTILLRRLETSYGISGQVLQWLTSFLSDSFCWSDINVAESSMWRTTGVRSRISAVRPIFC